MSILVYTNTWILCTIDNRYIGWMSWFCRGPRLWTIYVFVVCVNINSQKGANNLKIWCWLYFDSCFWWLNFPVDFHFTNWNTAMEWGKNYEPSTVLRDFTSLSTLLDECCSNGVIHSSSSLNACFLISVLFSPRKRVETGLVTLRLVEYSTSFLQIPIWLWMATCLLVASGQILEASLYAYVRDERYKDKVLDRKRGNPLDFHWIFSKRLLAARTCSTRARDNFVL